MIFSIPGCKEAMNDWVSPDAGVAIDWILGLGPWRTWFRGP